MSPAQRVDAVANAHGFSRLIVKGEKFEHVAYSNGLFDPDAPLHVYLEGDGTPYLNHRTAAPDPTPRHLVMLELMALDPGPAVYLGRPCYFGFASRPPCTTDDWTLRRFDRQIVASMASALAKVAGQTTSGRLELFGHSGGGTLAVLLARRVGGVARVVTLAGNLDHRAWSQIHGYSPLEGSLNPVDEGPLPEEIVQLHLVGEKDQNIPPVLVARAAGQLGAGKIRILTGVTHTCCWEAYWPAVLAGH